jgi:wyosine [tRNA(Phe)-imidazoG37] synthetase (radical SAM superfamily)
MIPCQNLSNPLKFHIGMFIANKEETLLETIMKNLNTKQDTGFIAGIMETFKMRLKAFSEKLQTGISKDLCEDGKVIFGPFLSTRLGMCLGINNVKSKACTYNCIYCKCGNTSRCSICCDTCLNAWNLASCVRRKITDLQKEGVEINYVAFMPDGEATLDSNIGQKIQLIREMGVKTAVFTNASLLWNYNVQQNLLSADNVIVKIDTVNAETWEKINRPHLRLSLNAILESVREFASQFRGELSTETVIVDGYNDNSEEIKELGEYFASLNAVASDFSFVDNSKLATQKITDPMMHLNLTDLIKRKIPGAVILGCKEANYYQAATG